MQLLFVNRSALRRRVARFLRRRWRLLRRARAADVLQEVGPHDWLQLPTRGA